MEPGVMRDKRTIARSAIILRTKYYSVHEYSCDTYSPTVLPFAHIYLWYLYFSPCKNLFNNNGKSQADIRTMQAARRLDSAVAMNKL